MALLLRDNQRYGTRGEHIQVATNSFEIKSLPNKTYFQYTIAIEPTMKTHARQRELIHKLQTTVDPNTFHPQGLYDGQFLLFSSKKYTLSAGNSGVYLVSMTDRPPRSGERGTYEVKIALTTGAEINPSDLLELIRGGQATTKSTVSLNILQMLIRAGPNLASPTSNNGRAYFTEDSKQSLENGFELWRGYFYNVRPSVGKLIVNVDTAVTAAYTSGRLVDIAMKFLNLRDTRQIEKLKASDPKYQQMTRHFRKQLIRLSTQGSRGIKTIRGFVEQGGFHRFLNQNGQEITVEEHFKLAHNITLRFPGAPGVVTSSRSAPTMTVIPMECCDVIPGQLCKKAPDSLTQDMVKFSNQRPDQRLRSITQGKGNVSASPVTQITLSTFMQESGMSLDTRPMSITGRKLKPPTLAYGGIGPNANIQAKNGSWNVANMRLKNPKHLQRWGIVVYASVTSIPENIARQFIDRLIGCSKKLGMKVDNPLYINAGNGQAIDAGLDNAAAFIFEETKQPPGLILVILPKNAIEIKSAVKLWGDVKKGVLTQCVREDRIFNPNRNQVANDQYCNNVTLKLNARLGGDNSVVRSPILEMLAKQPFIIFGADVGHPGPGSGRPSFTSLVSSLDVHANRYISQSSVQPPRREIIEDLQSMVKNAILELGHPPARLIFYRDGVSEGEYGVVAEKEIGQIKAACKEIWMEKDLKNHPPPKLTFIVVGKRHHIRFFPQQSRDGDEKSGNLHSGFVADKGINSPNMQDFYLQSQGGLQGTSRPSHYIILEDENFDNKIDDIQELSFALCHVYAKATRSVSIPAPVYYADLVCRRAPFYIDRELENQSVSSGNEPFNLQAWDTGYKRVNRQMRRNMYFL